MRASWFLSAMMLLGTTAHADARFSCGGAVSIALPSRAEARDAAPVATPARVRTPHASDRLLTRLDMDKVPPKFRRLLEMGFLRRYWDRPEVIQTAQELHALGGPETGGMGGYNLAWPGIQGGLAKAVSAGNLKYSIGTIAQIINGEILPYGKNSAGLDTDFARVMTAVFRAIDLDLQAGADVQSLTFEGTVVLNQRLVEMMKKMGFEKQATWGDWDPRLPRDENLPVPGTQPDFSFGGGGFEPFPGGAEPTAPARDDGQLILPGMDSFIPPRREATPEPEQLKLPLEIWVESPDYGQTWSLQMPLRGSR